MLDPREITSCVAVWRDEYKKVLMTLCHPAWWQIEMKQKFLTYDESDDRREKFLKLNLNVRNFLFTFEGLLRNSVWSLCCFFSGVCGEKFNDQKRPRERPRNFKNNVKIFLVQLNFLFFVSSRAVLLSFIGTSIIKSLALWWNEKLCSSSRKEEKKTETNKNFKTQKATKQLMRI